MSEVNGRKILVLTHLGVGDAILCHGLVKHLATCYEEVKLVVTEYSSPTARFIFKFVPNVIFHTIPDGKNWAILESSYLNILYPEYTQLRLGFHGGYGVNLSIFPLSFYDNACVPRKMFWMPAVLDYSEEDYRLYNTVRDISYAFIHNNSSTGIVFDDAKAIAHLGIDTNTCLVVNTHKNIYPIGHKFYELAQSFLTQRLLTDYCRVIENANYIVVSDSAMFSLCHLLNIRSTCNYVVKRDRNADIFRTLYQAETYGGDIPEIRVRFDILEI